MSAALEGALIRLFEKASLSFHVMDREGHVLRGNPQFLAQVGPQEGETELGFARLRQDLPPEQARTWFLRAFEHPGEAPETAVWLRGDGTLIPVWMTVAGLRTATGDRLFVWAWDRSEEQRATDRLVENADLQRHLAEGIYAMSLARTQKEAHQELIKRASAILPGLHWFLGRVNPEEGGRKISLVAWTDSLRERMGPVIQSLVIPVPDSAFAREVYDQRRQCFIEDIQNLPEAILPLAEAPGIKSLLGAPLVFEGRVTGVLFALNFLDESPVLPQETQIEILQSLTRIAALALDRIHAEGQLEEAAALARNLAAGVRDLAGAADEGALVTILFRWAAKLAPLPEWWFNRYDPQARTTTTTRWTPGIEAFGTPEEIQRPLYIDESPMLAGMHVSQRSIHIPRCEGHPDLQDRDPWPFRTYVGLPLVHEGDVVGTLGGGSFGSQGHIPVSDDQFKALESLAEAAGLVLNRLHARTALEEEEARFRLLFEQSPDPIILVSQGTIVDANAAAAGLFGIEREAMCGLSVLDISPERQPDGLTSIDGHRVHVQAALSGKHERFEWTFRCAEGVDTTCLVDLTRLDHGGQPIIHAIVRDLTAQKRAETERATLERQLFQAQKMESLGVLAGGIAHDFNNLLMGVLGHAGLALEQLNPLHPGRRNLEAIQKVGQRAADLTRQMLAYSGRGQFIVRDLDLTTQVTEMLHLLEVSLPKTVVLRLDLHKGLPAVSADASQIQQVIMNLVINAAEAIGEASGTITLSTGAQQLEGKAIKKMLVGQDAAPGPYVFLEVTDTGCGMDADTLGRIFEPFFTTKFTGRGLGLSAIMGIVRGHKGALRVYSEVGLGTTFKVLFPALGLRAEANPPSGPEVPWSGVGMILVVDDDETVRTVARQALELKGFQVMDAHDGRVAVELVRKHGSEIGLVLLDMTMPHMGGEDAFREMRLIRPDIRVILSSGYNETEAMSRFMGKGLKGFIQKPYGPKALLAKIHTALEG